MKRVLAHRDLRLLFGALTISSIGSWSYNVVLLAFVYDRTASLDWVGAVALARFVPPMIVSPYAGVVAERFERVRLLFRLDLVAAAFQAGLAVVAITEAPLELALLLSALTAITTTPHTPAIAALIPQVAGEEELAPANALNGTIGNLVVIAGPAIGALVLVIGPHWAAFGLNAASFVVSAAILSRLRVRSAPSDVTEGGGAGPLRQIKAAFAAMRATAGVVPLVSLMAVAAFVYGTDTVLLLAAAEGRLGMGTSGFGLFLTALGVGGILVTFVVDRLAATPRTAFLLLGAMTIYTLPLLLVALTTSPALGLGGHVLRGAGAIVVDVLMITALQRSLAQHMIARVFGVLEAIIFGAIVLGVIVAPRLSSALGLEGALLLMALAPVALTLTAIPALLRVDRAAVVHVAGIAERVALLERLGLFESASRAIVERLAASAEEQNVAAGTAVVREGDPANAFYVVLEGNLRVTSGEAGHIRDLGPETWFGEIGLMLGVSRTATVTALGPARLLRIEGDAFIDALTTTPPAAALLEQARGRLARTHPTLSIDSRPAPGPAR